ncbi:multimodular transpeptidase-transglycosylase [Vibrio astriarenae]|nr:multimodular transpeptidase-transglycosylase [Vibrio sp. C7]
MISEQTAFLMREMMYSNVWGGGNWREGTGWNGTGWRAQSLKRRDIGGKTGTTNDSKDAWYNAMAQVSSRPLGWVLTPTPAN